MAASTRYKYKPETAEPFLSLQQKQEDAPAWLGDLNRDAYNVLKNQGLPQPKLERWKFTNLLTHTKPYGDNWSKADVDYIDPHNLVSKLGDSLANPQDWLQEILSRKSELVFRYQDMSLWDLSNLFLRDGLIIDVPEEFKSSEPIEITITGHDGEFIVPRTVFRLGKGSELTIIERHSGQGSYWNNRLTQIVLAEGAKLKHYRVQENSASAVYTQNTHVQLDSYAQYEAFNFCMGSKCSRNQVHAELNGENAQSNMFGINLLKDGQHADTTIEVEHKAPNCNSSQYIRSVLNDHSRGVFQGKVHVHPGADHTDGSQMSNALLLSEGAEMDTKPELEIYADEVQCAHGATTGKLEDEPLFYMRSRGIPEEQARLLLIQAFVNEVIECLSDESLNEELEKKVKAWLS